MSASRTLFWADKYGEYQYNETDWRAFRFYAPSPTRFLGPGESPRGPFYISSVIPAKAGIQMFNTEVFPRHGTQPAYPLILSLPKDVHQLSLWSENVCPEAVVRQAHMSGKRLLWHPDDDYGDAFWIPAFRRKDGMGHKKFLRVNSGMTYAF